MSSSRSDYQDSAPSAAVFPLAGLRLLYAEDEAHTRRAFALALGRSGAEVTVVADGVAAVVACREAEAAGRPFHLALLDYRMPGFDGTEVALALTTSRFTGTVVGLTAGVDAAEARQWRENGCRLILPKSLGPAGIVSRLAAFLGPADAGRAIGRGVPAVG